MSGSARYIAAAVLILGLSLLFHFSNSHEGQRYGRVAKGSVVQRLTVAGQVRPLRRTTFMAPTAGYVLKIFVQVGQKIEANDPVVTLKSSLQSPEPVYPLRAPFAGSVVSVSKMEGEYVNEKDAKDVIARVDDNSKFFVVARAPELEASRIRKGMEVELRVSALESGQLLKGVVRTIDLAAEEADGWKSQQATFNVRVEILNPPADLRSGQSAILDIVTERRDNALYLGHEFLDQEGGKYFVTNSHGKRLPVTIGLQSDTVVEIKDGVSEGDEVEQIDFLKSADSGA